MKRVFLIAGEPSGDALGGRLMESIKKRTSNTVTFSGVGGPTMATQGLQSLFPMSDLSVMGLAEVLPRLPRLISRIRTTAEAIAEQQPSVVVMIDAPDFCFRVAKKIKATHPTIPIVHLVAPTVWAWRPGRAHRVAQFLDHMLCLLPFEPPYFEREGLKATFIGHPVIEGGADHGDGAAFRRRHHIAEDVPILAVLPGSRTGEITRHLPIFRETLGRLIGTHPGLTCVIATVPHVADRVRTATQDWPTPVILIDGTGDGASEKYAAFAAANVALAASGTVSVELALAGCPTVVAYRVNAATAFIAKRLIRVKYASLVNLIADEEIIPEFIQDTCRPEVLANAVSDLLINTDAQTAQKVAFKKAVADLGQGGPPPSDRAADVICGYL